MSILPRTRFVSAPLLPLTLALCGGIVLQHYFHITSQRTLVAFLAVTVAVCVLSLMFLKARKLLAAALFLLIAFLCTGVLLAPLTESAPSSDRVARLYDDGTLTPGDPVEVGGVVSGEPEPAPGSFYLTIQVERLTFRNIDRDASGTMLLLAPVPTEQSKHQYEALELRHGARIRVMTNLDREDDFRNPGVSQFTVPERSLARRSKPCRSISSGRRGTSRRRPRSREGSL